jgi:spore maturation protein CgeB
MRVLIVGNDGGTNIGGSFLRAAARLGWEAELLPSRQAMAAPSLVRQVCWRLLGRRPPRLGRFSAAALGALDAFRPQALVATGLAPLTAEVLGEVAKRGVRTVNYLTDDPFGPAHRASWFLAALVRYHAVASPRRANLGDLEKLGCRSVRYVPFGYDPELHFPVPPRPDLECDVLFVGGYEPERAPFPRHLVKNGFDLRLHGDRRWRRAPGLRTAYRGHTGPEGLRAATCSARINVAMGRRQNRDGHTMRTFEVPACGAALLAEDTREHRDLLASFLPEDWFFSGPEDLADKTRRALDDPRRRAEVAARGRHWATRGRHRYDDRLSDLLALAEALD